MQEFLDQAKFKAQQQLSITVESVRIKIANKFARAQQELEI